MRRKKKNGKVYFIVVLVGCLPFTTLFVRKNKIKLKSEREESMGRYKQWCFMHFPIQTISASQRKIRHDLW